VIGDADPLVADFWSVAVRRPEELVEAMRAEVLRTSSSSRCRHWQQIGEECNVHCVGAERGTPAQINTM